jgi:hypothetical protein
VKELGPLGLVPWSLGNMFSLKGEHGVLQNILDTVHPTLDVLDFLAAPNAREVVSQSVATNAKGPIVYSLLNPTIGECWLVRGFGFSATLIAGDALRARGIVIGNLGQGIKQITDENTGTAGITVSSYLRVPPFILYSGESLSVFVTDITSATTIAIAASATILRFHS